MDTDTCQNKRIYQCQVNYDNRSSWRVAICLIGTSLSLVSAHNNEAKIPTECPVVDSMEVTVNLAHEQDCTKFYICSNGRKILMSCPLMDHRGNKLHFNPVLQVCDWPRHAGCRLNSGTTVKQSVTSTTRRSKTTTTTTVQPTERPTESTPESTTSQSSTQLPGESTTESESSTAPDLATETAANRQTEATSQSTVEAGTSRVTEEPTTELKNTSEPTTELPSTNLPIETTSEATARPSVAPSSESPSESAETSTVALTEAPSQLLTSPAVEVTTPEATSSPTERIPALPSSRNPSEGTTQVEEVVSTSPATQASPTESETSSAATVSSTVPPSVTSTSENPSESTGTSTIKLTEAPSTNPTTNSVPESTSEASTARPLSPSSSETPPEETEAPTQPSTSTPGEVSTAQTTQAPTTEVKTSSEAIPSSTAPPALPSSTEVPSESPESSTIKLIATSAAATNSAVDITTSQATQASPSSTTELAASSEATPSSTESIAVPLSTENSVQNPETPLPSTATTTEVSQTSVPTTNAVLGSTASSIDTTTASEINAPETTSQSSVNSSDGSNNTSYTTEQIIPSTSDQLATKSPTSSELPLIPDIVEDFEAHGHKPAQSPALSCSMESTGTFYPHESNCSLFYECVWGELILRRCAEGLYFDSHYQVCVWPWETDCHPSHSTLKPTTFAPTSTVKPSSSSTPTTAEPESTTEFDVVNPIDACTFNDSTNNGLMYPHECFCNKFYICTNSGLILRQCPRQLQFNPSLSICDWPQNVGCSVTSALVTAKPVVLATTQSPPVEAKCPATGNARIPHETSCQEYYDCKNGSKSLKHCSEGLNFNSVLGICDWPEYVQCTSSNNNQDKVTNADKDVYSTSARNDVTDDAGCVGNCPKHDSVDYTVLLQHKDCNKFCMCSNGKAFVKTCQAGLVFNPKFNVCDYSENVKCANNL